MLGKNFPFHLTAHSNALAASSWVMELILPQIYLILFRSPPQQVSTLHSLIYCCFSMSRAVWRNDKILKKSRWLWIVDIICSIVFGTGVSFPQGILSFFAFENLAPGSKFVSIVMHSAFRMRWRWTDITAVTQSLESTLFHTTKKYTLR